MPSRRPALLLLLPVLLLLATGCSGMAGTGDLEYVQGENQVIEFDEAEREGPIDLQGTTVTGEPYDWEPGQVTVVNVWWSGCGPCIREMPMLTELDAAYDGDVEFLGINIRDTSAANAAAFERDRGVQYPSIYDPTGEALLSFPGRAAPRYPPTTLVLDPEGMVTAIINGEIPSRTTLTSLVEAAGGPSAPEPVDG